jgi:hypothetical protein
MMQSDRELHDPEASPKVPAGDCNRIDRFGAQLVGHLPQARLREAPQIIRTVEGI